MAVISGNQQQAHNQRERESTLVLDHLVPDSFPEPSTYPSKGMTRVVDLTCVWFDIGLASDWNLSFARLVWSDAWRIRIQRHNQNRIQGVKCITCTMSQLMEVRVDSLGASEAVQQEIYRGAGLGWPRVRTGKHWGNTLQNSTMHFSSRISTRFSGVKAWFHLQMDLCVLGDWSCLFPE